VTPPNPSLLMQLALAHRSSCVLFAALNLDLFTILGGGPLSASDVATRAGSALEPTRLLLEACASEGLLTSDGRQFSNSAVADAFLVRGRPAFSASAFKYAEDLYPTWGKLTDLVRSGRPPIEPEALLGDDEEKTRHFVYAMHERAKGIGSVLAHIVDLSGRRSLLDVGGGPGTYSVALIRQTPGLRATVLDVPGVLRVARALVDASGVADRITLMPGDYLSSPFGSGYDVALLSGMMHRETPASCDRLLRKSFDALDSGGLAIVSDVFFDDDSKRSPAFAVYFALNMMLTSAEGSAHAKTEMAAWMTRAGFTGVRVQELPKPNPHTLVLGTKP